MPRFMYCIYCAANAERGVAEAIEKSMHIRAIHLCYDREEQCGGQWITRTYPLYGEYLFAYADDPAEIRRFYEIDGVRRVLRYGDGNCNLNGEDRVFAQFAWECGGHIGISQAMKVGDRTKVVGGPLKNYEGTILKYDRHRRRALVDVASSGNIKPVWMYFEWLTEADDVLIKIIEAIDSGGHGTSSRNQTNE